MLPAALFTVITPSPTTHCAGVWSFTATHSSRFLPSNRMIASDGGAPQVAPGVTTTGSGDHTSVSSGLRACGLAWPNSMKAAPTSINSDIDFASLLYDMFSNIQRQASRRLLLHILGNRQSQLLG